MRKVFDKLKTVGDRCLVLSLILCWGVTSLKGQELGFAVIVGDTETPIILPILSETPAKLFIALGIFMAIDGILPDKTKEWGKERLNGVWKAYRGKP